MGDSPGERLVLFRQEQGFTQSQLAAALGVSPATIAFVERNERAPSRSFLQKISGRYGISSDWLLYGVGDKTLPLQSGFSGRSVNITPIDFAKPLHGDFNIGSREFAFVPRLEFCATTNTGFAKSDKSDDGVAFPVEWLRMQNVTADFAILVNAGADESMMPTIPPHSTVLIDSYVKSFEAEGIYAYIHEGIVRIRRVIPARVKDKISTLTIAADQHSEPARTATLDEASRTIRIIGRVRAVLTSL